MRDLALRLLAVEAAGESASEPRAQEALRVLDKLRIALTTLAGADGFKSLLRRALALARQEVPALASVQIQGTGSLEGFESLASDEGGGASDAAAAITARLLSLLVVFIGQPLTLQIVREIWPAVALDELPPPPPPKSRLRREQAR